MEVLVVAEEDAWLASLGVSPQIEEVSGDDYVREVRFPISGSEELHVTWDTTHQSVRLRYKRGGEVICV
jgi:hypothetical protein